MQDPEHGHAGARSSDEPMRSPERAGANLGELPFEAWHFQRSAMVQHLVFVILLALGAFNIFLYPDDWASAAMLVNVIVGLCMLAGRIAAHAWLEPVFAQKLVSNLVFGSSVVLILLLCATAPNLEGHHLQGTITLETLGIPMSCFMCTTFPLTRTQSLSLVLLLAVASFGGLYSHGTVRVLPWASNAMVGLFLGLDYVASVALFLFLIDAQNRETHRLLLQSSRAQRRERAFGSEESQDHIARGLSTLTVTNEARPTGYVRLDESSGSPSIATDPPSVGDVDACDSTPRHEALDATDVPFETWHFRHSAMAYHLALCAVAALDIVFLLNKSPSNTTIDWTMIVFLSLALAGRAAARTWLEPVFAQKLVSNLAFGGMIVTNLLLVVGATNGEQVLLQAQYTMDFYMDMLFIPMTCFLCTTFPFTIMQSLLVVLLKAVADGCLLYTASAHWTVRVMLWASNVTAGLILGVVYTLSALFLFLIDAHNRRKYLGNRRMGLELHEARRLDHRRRLQLEDANRLNAELERARRRSLEATLPAWTHPSWAPPLEMALLHQGQLPDGLSQLEATEGQDEGVPPPSRPPCPPSESPPPSIPPGPVSRSSRSSSTSRGSRRLLPEASAASETNPFESVYDSVISLLLMHKVALPVLLERVRTDLRPHIDELLPDESAAEFVRIAIQLIMLKRVHASMQPEAAFAKLHAISAALNEPCQALGSHGRLLVDKLRSYMTRMVLRYGAMSHITEGDFTLPEDEVGALLNRYQWAADSTRTHVHHIIRKSLRAVALFRAAATTALATGSLSEADDILKPAYDELVRAMNRVLEEHGMQADPTMQLASVSGDSNAQAGTRHV